MPHISTSQSHRERVRRRLRHRIMAGLWYHRNEPIRFITLSTDENQHTDVNYAFKKMVQHLRRNGYEFEYIAVFTDERNGVIHLLQVGKYIDWLYLKILWMDFSGCSKTDIRGANRKRRGEYQRQSESERVGKITSYIIGQYVGNQDMMRHVQFSRGWLPPRAIAQWKRIKIQCCYCIGQEDDYTPLWASYNPKKALLLYRKWLDLYSCSQK